MRDLKTIAHECMAELDLLDVPYGEVVEWEVNYRALKRWGQCRRVSNGTYEININYDLLQESTSLNGLKETILHELIHTVPGCMNHGPQWNHWVARVNAAYGYNIKRCNSAADKGCTEHRTAKATYKYTIECNKCHTVWKKQRMSSLIKACTEGNARCSCGCTKFTVREVR